MGNSGEAVEHTAHTVDQLLEIGLPGGKGLLVVLLCLGFNMLDGFDITAMSVTASQISQDMSLSDDRLGLIFSFSLAGMTIGAMFLASIADVLGRRKVVIGSLIVVGLSVLLTSAVESFPQLLVLRFISGLGAGALLASQAALASEYAPERYRALAVAAVTAGYPMGAMLTGLVAGAVVPEYGWRAMFLLGGGVTLAVVFVAFMYLPESLHYLLERRPPGALPRINAILQRFSFDMLKSLPAERECVERGGTDPGDMRERAWYFKLLDLMAPAYRRPTIWLWLAFFMCFYTLYFLMSWIPKMVVDAGFTVELGNQSFTVFNLGGVLGIFLMGFSSTRWPLARIISLFLVLACAGMLAFFWFPDEATVILVAYLLIGVTLQGGFTGLYATAAKLYPTQLRSTGVGWAIGLGRFGAVIGPAVAGLLIVAGASMRLNMLAFALPLLVAAFIVHRLNVR